MTTPSPQATDRTEPVHTQLQYQLALFARRMEQVRTSGGGLGALDRAAYLLLDRLERHGPANVKALAEALGVDSSTVTRQVAPLVAAGLVGRVQDPADRRAVRLALTPGGCGRLAEVRDCRAELARHLVADWPPEEQHAFCALLARFNHAMESYSADRQGQ
ncbi:MarR family winged helix-turn-helix transcriptional regulator [Kitasatospora sp. SUK 42]|uniref:MarR family winged helix-turn-helix transcriptional regulator n=1 Tax=Kitasatospora sp. SUK 42 TaxID=1588882 RepID=UPI0018CA4C24|nr:MarR family transcriptional regulator [Kitasatospora sp. SUK 42]MBV2152265.1 MarR family transcriptional regulator [Kitasatospora sp. SUK 42]